jgi:RNA polymerase sigma factor (sigma-70 family)
MTPLEGGRVDVLSAETRRSDAPNREQSTEAVHPNWAGPADHHRAPTDSPMTILCESPLRPTRSQHAPPAPDYGDAMPPGEADSAWPDVAIERAWYAGDDTALRAAWDRFGALVFTYCVRAVGDRDTAADCTQETFVSAWRSRARFDRSRGSLASWLLGIARYRVLDVYRAAPKVPTPSDPDHLTAGAHGDDADAVADRLLVADALGRLPERPRRVINLSFYSDLSQREIADHLGLPLGTVKSDMRRGLLRLRDQLEGRNHDVRPV